MEAALIEVKRLLRLAQVYENFLSRAEEVLKREGLTVEIFDYEKDLYSVTEMRNGEAVELFEGSQLRATIFALEQLEFKLNN